MRTGAGGQIQLTDDIARLLAEERVLACGYIERGYACGRLHVYIEGNVDSDVKPPDPAPSLTAVRQRDVEW